MLTLTLTLTLRLSPRKEAKQRVARPLPYLTMSVRLRQRPSGVKMVGLPPSRRTHPVAVEKIKLTWRHSLTEHGPWALLDVAQPCCCTARPNYRDAPMYTPAISTFPSFLVCCSQAGGLELLFRINEKARRSSGLS